MSKQKSSRGSGKKRRRGSSGSGRPIRDKRRRPEQSANFGERTDLVTEDEASQMFAVWCRTGNLSEVARQFKRSKTTIRRWYKKKRWAYRKKEMEVRRDMAIAEAEAKQEMSDRDLVYNLRNKIFNELLAEGHAIDPSVSDAIRVIQLLQELDGKRPVGGDVNIFKAIIEIGTDARPSDEGLGNRLTSYGNYFSRIKRGETKDADR